MGSRLRGEWELVKDMMDYVVVTRAAMVSSPFINFSLGYLLNWQRIATGDDIVDVHVMQFCGYGFSTDFWRNGIAFTLHCNDISFLARRWLSLKWDFHHFESVCLFREIPYCILWWVLWLELFRNCCRSNHCADRVECQYFHYGVHCTNRGDHNSFYR